MIYPELVYKIRGCVFDVYNNLLGDWSEKVIEEILYDAFDSQGMKVDRQVEFEIYYKENRVGLYRTDLIVDKKIIIELKIVPEIFPLHKAQIISYLKVTGLPLGLLINFGGSKLFIKGYPNNVSNNKVLNIPFDIDKVNLSNNKKELIEPFLSISKEILETLGPGYFHQVYRRAFWYELKDQDIDFEIIKQLELIYKGKTYASKEVRFYKVNDLLISIVSVNKLDDRILYNLSKYKKYYNCKDGLIINFNSTVIDFRLL